MHFRIATLFLAALFCSALGKPTKMMRHRRVIEIKSTDENIGSLSCASNGMFYAVDHRQALILAYGSETTFPDAIVESVYVGDNENLVQCEAELNEPATNVLPAGPHPSGGKYHAIFVPQNDCGNAVNVNNNIITINNRVKVTVIVDFGFWFEETVLIQPVTCQGDLTAQATLAATIVNVPPTILSSLEGNFVVPVISSAGSNVFPGYLSFVQPKQVFTLEFKLMDRDRSLYDMLVEECLMSPFSDPNAAQRVPVLRARGCNANTQVTRFDHTSVPQVVETLSPKFKVPMPDDRVYFTCKINICPKMTSASQFCVPSCGPKRAYSVKQLKEAGVQTMEYKIPVDTDKAEIEYSQDGSYTIFGQ